MASTPSNVEAGRLRAHTCGPGVLLSLFVWQRYMVAIHSDHLRPGGLAHVRSRCGPGVTMRWDVVTRSSGRSTRRSGESGHWTHFTVMYITFGSPPCAGARPWSTCSPMWTRRGGSTGCVTPGHGLDTKRCEGAGEKPCASEVTPSSDGAPEARGDVSRFARV